MTSQRQIAANRRNAAKSTGPVSAAGKARSSRNALRHGLSRPLSSPAMTAANVGEFALQLVGEEASSAELDLARAVANAQLDLARVRDERARLLELLMSAPSSRAGRGAKKASPGASLDNLDRYERRACSRRNKALANLSQFGRLPIFE
jgi:hypothetical protein